MARTIFVVGSSSGIGLEIVRLFFSKGWNVVAASRNPSASEDLQALRSQDPARILLVALELTNPETFAPALDSAVKVYGAIDVLLNNAGINILGAFELLSEEKLRKQLEVNFFGPAQLTRLAIPHLRSSATKSGKQSLIISITSGSGHFGIPLFSYYTASKFALEGLTEALYHELAPHGIAVKNIVPAGGIKGTKLGPNSFPDAEPLLVATLMGQQPDLSSEEPERKDVLKKYIDNGARTMGKTMILSDQAEGAKSAADVAEAVWGAVEDGESKFRYFVGADGHPFVEAKYGEKCNDEDYMEKVRAFFA
ncbi:NAD(P)-binding protein [Karstenula rhodostoma CBS 690.94]|uniref:NAD(P)-binding protein n=1 Tax=Karstenula rhodostoma CBS 690.94 TaxID=1392251 RepID=A0A9P4P5R6_9PLEO|nr:NAD(P)-binding protein [Karstenula rhodostoma CBS 690.94]